MSKEMEFFIFLIEQYASEKHTTADEVIRKIEDKGLTDYIFGMYELYHTESLDNAFEDIDRMCNDQQNGTMRSVKA